MKQHQYRINVQYLSDHEGQPVNQDITFEAPNHDNLFNIIAMTEQREGFTPEMAQRFVVGLKLLGEVMLENRDNPLFRQLRPHFMEMMKVIKGKNKTE
ncbi:MULTISPECIES: DUF3861 domain-containing protein [Pasteurellaceae]|uniref:DUF3861 domain-containing protein n=1 Tax=Pasteurellaceae TaxID=712 RepID=UPI000509A3CB